jgi:hypothetical protein
MGEWRGLYRVWGGGNLRGGDHLEDPGVDERIILEWILEKWYGGAWTGSIWFRDKWRAVVNAVMNLRVP